MKINDAVKTIGMSLAIKFDLPGTAINLLEKNPALFSVQGLIENSIQNGAPEVLGKLLEKHTLSDNEIDNISPMIPKLKEHTIPEILHTLNEKADFFARKPEIASMFDSLQKSRTFFDYKDKLGTAVLAKDFFDKNPQTEAILTHLFVLNSPKISSEFSSFLIKNDLLDPTAKFNGSLSHTDNGMESKLNFVGISAINSNFPAVKAASEHGLMKDLSANDYIALSDFTARAFELHKEHVRQDWDNGTHISLTMDKTKLPVPEYTQKDFDIKRINLEKDGSAFSRMESDPNYIPPSFTFENKNNAYQQFRFEEAETMARELEKIRVKAYDNLSPEKKNQVDDIMNQRFELFNPNKTIETSPIKIEISQESISNNRNKDNQNTDTQPLAKPKI